MKVAEDYPTLGPAGLTNMDVNEMACSIEMYLGENFIKQDGKYIPIQWEGYSPKVGAYQGKIMQKELIQNRFLSFIEAAKKDKSLIKTVEISNIELIFEQIFDAFDPIELAEEN